MPKQKFTVTGSPADAAGNIKLVGAGSLQGGSPDTDDFLSGIPGCNHPAACVKQDLRFGLSKQEFTRFS